jgi:hypothetical protein
MKIKNWKKFQHFTDRRPPWIKLYRDLLDDIEWHNLDADAAKFLTGLWLLASEDESREGTLPDVKTIAFRLRKTEKVTTDCISRLSNWLIQDDINMISKVDQLVLSETETETETEASFPSGTSDADFWEEIKKLYTWVNVDQERAKMQGWLLTPRGKGRKLTRRFVCNWLNKIDKPMEPQPEVRKFVC